MGGATSLPVPWAEAGTRFTALFEALAIAWLQQAAIATVAERLRLSWDEAAGIQARAVRRGLARRSTTPARHLGIDETAFARRHQYVTVVTDLDRAQVLFVAEDRQAREPRRVLAAAERRGAGRHRGGGDGHV